MCSYNCSLGLNIEITRTTTFSTCMLSQYYYQEFQPCKVVPIQQLLWKALRDTSYLLLNKPFHCVVAIISSLGFISLWNIKASPCTAILLRCNSLYTGSKLYHYLFFLESHALKWIQNISILSFYVHNYWFTTAKINTVF